MPESDVGQYFGKYFLLKRLAAGGMGEVFLAKQQGPAGFEKILIVKKVLAHLTENKEFVELFLGEARLAARMNHRNIVQVFELGEQDGSYFIAMEYIQGKTLRDAIDVAIKHKEKIPAELCRSVAEQICEGSSYAHNLTDIAGRCLNIVHRDLNPANVLVSYTGDVKVIDFGIAKSEMSTVKTEAGMIKGKFIYMSPEQSMAKKLDKRSDIFAIGISLYEMLTGINPFHKNNIVLTLEAVQRYDPPPVSDYDPALAPFDPIIAKALVKDRDRRYGDAADMQDDLRRIVLPPSPERLGPWMSRMFRAQLAEEQKILKDTDAARVTSGAKMGSRTPSRPVAAPQGAETGGSTLVLPPTAAKSRSSGTPARPIHAPVRPAPRAPAPPPKKAPQGAGDTLMDMQAPVVPGVNAPPAAAGEGGQNKTAFLGTAPARPERHRRPPTAPPPNGVGGTNIMTQEESHTAQQEALAKMQANQAGGGATPAAPQPIPRPRVGTRTGPPPTAKKSGKGLWIALGVGGVVTLGLVITLAMWLLADDKPVRRKPVPPVVPVEEKAPSPEEKAPEEKTPEEKGPDEKRPKEKKADQQAADEKKGDAPSSETPVADDKKPKKGKDKVAAPPAPEEMGPPSDMKPPTEVKPTAEKKPPAEKKADKSVGTKMFGTLLVNPGPNIPLAFNGTSMGKVAGAQRLSINRDAGTVVIGDASTPYKMTLEYKVTGKEISVKVAATPWAIVFLDGTSKGKTPLANVKLEDKLTQVELKKPGQESGMSVRVRFTPSP